MDIFDGAELLMNQKKRTSDAGSIRSMSSYASKASKSSKSSKAHSKSSKGSRHEKIVIDIGRDDSSSYSPKKKKKSKKPKKKQIVIESESESDESDTISIATSSSKSSATSISKSSSSSSSSSEYSAISSVSSSHVKKMSHEEIQEAKRELLYQFDRLDRKGFRVPRKFSMSSSYEEMKHEFERLTTDREVEISIKFQRSIMMNVVMGIEYLNNQYDPFDLKLGGWSENINDSIDDYTDVFEKLHTKYRGKASMPPELTLLFMICSSAFFFHFTKAFMKSSLPGMEQVMKQNPDLVRQFAAAAMNQQGQGQPSKSSGGFGGILSGLSGMFGGFGSGLGPPPPQNSNAQFQQAHKMRGPSDIDDIFNELNNQQSNNNRVETMSTVSASDMTEILDDASTISGGVFTQKKVAKSNRRTLNI
jgi:hypothetical protein